MAKDVNNDAFVLHSLPLALTITNIMDCQWAIIAATCGPVAASDDDFYGDGHVTSVL